MRQAIRRWRMRVPIALALALGVGSGPLAAGDPGSGSDSQRIEERLWPRIAYPSQRAVRSAQRFAAGWGDVSFAVIGRSSGLRGYQVTRTYGSASASKVILLAAQLRALQRDKDPLDSGARALLEPMIVYSDNDAAGGIYARVGDAGLEDVAERAGMRDFSVDPGFWGGAQITAADMARFYFRLERNLGRRYRDYGMRLLSSITPTQRWGIPVAAGRSWHEWFKGGWRPGGQEGTTGPVTHQAALLVHRGGERLAIAVLSNEAPGTGGGFDAVEGVTARLLAKAPPRRGGWVVP
jgi:Beta-lactamase enzyme family